jgi:hypothetical protein
MLVINAGGMLSDSSAEKTISARAKASGLGRIMRNLAPAIFVSVVAATPMIASAETPQLSPKGDAFYEMRTYYPMPGKLAELNTRFRDHTLRLFAKHGMTSVGYWLQEDQPNGKLIYVLAYKDLAAREKAWAEFRADPEWQAAAKASEANGKLVEKVESIYMKMADYSPALHPSR